jgi:peptidoglycan/xylan/chitin deacetylase (PgdA/CDA1 family)
MEFSWPPGRQAAVLITHDVEQAAGQANIPHLRAIENDLGLHSCWNFPTSRYPVDETLIAELFGEGHEVGIHGVRHDGKLFSSPMIFRQRLEEIVTVAERWGSRGFRSPSLLYDEDLLAELPLVWDSSQSAWDPFQPQAGGCGRYVPFRLQNGCVELPVTLWQDFTLFEELQCRNIDIWKLQIDDLYRGGALINLIVHPDYMLSTERLAFYRELLEHLLSKSGLWIALPAEIAQWVTTGMLSSQHTEGRRT